MRSRAQRKAYKAALAATTQEELARRRLRMAAQSLNAVAGPDKTAHILYQLNHLFATPSEYRRVAEAEWKENQ